METDDLTGRIIGCAIEVHRQLGPGLLESIYESALAVELEFAKIDFARQVAVSMVYRGKPIGEHRIDLIVEKSIVVELKSVERIDPVFEAQVLTYLRLTNLRVGLLANFNSHLLHQRIKRLVL
jgi:GxxExxY protein